MSIWRRRSRFRGILLWRGSVRSLSWGMAIGHETEAVPLNLVVKARYDRSELSIASCVEHLDETISSNST
jgi:hypothetical protein